MATGVIETRGLRKRYRRVDALRGLDLEVPAGSICGFLGPNGAGKTTTMRILMGLIRPSEGWASVLGDDIDGNGLATRSRIGYLPQDPSFFPRSTVRNTLRFVGRRYVSGSKAAIESRVDEVLDLVGLADLADRKVKALSGGERRRLGIGQAVIGNPDLLILDEPSVGLDPEGRRQVLDLLEDLKQRMTIFYSSHILDDVERIADHVVILDHGEIIEQGPMESFLGGGAAKYRIVLDGDGTAVIDSLAREPWIRATRSIDPGAWEIEVADREAAEHHLLRLLHGYDGTRVMELRPEQRDLEDIYLGLVGAGNDD
ncbi:MAG: ATP-binding cassette domain-containing protein [Acidimicrobiia bacterium]|nr:MAG: ATP-binding cassette domain-containing protein [Acidimicrobiia bacterium]